MAKKVQIQIEQLLSNKLTQLNNKDAQNILDFAGFKEFTGDAKATYRRSSDSGARTIKGYKHKELELSFPLPGTSILFGISLESLMRTVQKVAAEYPDLLTRDLPIGRSSDVAADVTTDVGESFDRY